MSVDASEKDKLRVGVKSNLGELRGSLSMFCQGGSSIQLSIPRVASANTHTAHVTLSSLSISLPGGGLSLEIRGVSAPEPWDQFQPRHLKSLYEHIWGTQYLVEFSK